jgi:hypothetical protein
VIEVGVGEDRPLVEEPPEAAGESGVEPAGVVVPELVTDEEKN